MCPAMAARRFTGPRSHCCGRRVVSTTATTFSAAEHAGKGCQYAHQCASGCLCISVAAVGRSKHPRACLPARPPTNDLDDHVLGLLDPRLVIAERRTRHQAAVLQHCGDLISSSSSLPRNPYSTNCSWLRWMSMHRSPGMSMRLRVSGIGVRKPQMNATGHGERTVKLGAGGGAGEDADLELLSAQRRRKCDAPAPGAPPWDSRSR